jgi:cytochrome c553
MPQNRTQRILARHPESRRFVGALTLCSLLAVGYAWAQPASAPLPGTGSTWKRELGEAMLATPDSVAGEDDYAPCGACHGVDGRGVPDGSVPAIAGQQFTVIVKQLVDYRNQRRSDMQMEHAAHMRHLATGQDLADVAAFVSALPRGFAIGIGNGESLDLGARGYFVQCASCHGPLGQGNNLRGIPRLAGQHFGYLYRQFFDAIEQRRTNMGEAHMVRLRKLSHEQITGIADYLSRTSVELTRSP